MQTYRVEMMAAPNRLGGGSSERPRDLTRGGMAGASARPGYLRSCLDVVSSWMTQRRARRMAESFVRFMTASWRTDGDG